MATPMTTKEQFVDDLMLDALEDSIPLPDVAGLAIAAFPEFGPKAAREFAQDVVRDLLTRGWVELRSQTAEDFEGVPLRPERVDAARFSDALRDARQWSRETVGDAPTRYFIHATTKGNRELHESLLERGLYRPGPEHEP